MPIYVITMQRSRRSRWPESAPDHTEHYKGCVILTFCGKTVNIGRICGRRWIEDYARLEVGLSKADERERHRVALRGAPQTALAELRELRPTIDGLAAFQAGLKRFWPAVMGTLKAHPIGRTGVEIPLPKSEIEDDKDRRRPRTATHHLTGTSVGDSRLSGAWARDLADDLQQLVDEIAKSDLRVPRTLYLRWRHLDEKLVSLRPLLEAREQFFLHRNLELLKVATEQTGTKVSGLIVNDGAYEFDSHGQRYVLGKHGLRKST